MLEGLIQTRTFENDNFFITTFAKKNETYLLQNNTKGTHDVVVESESLILGVIFIVNKN